LLILEIAAGIVLAVLILNFWPYLVVAAVGLFTVGALIVIYFLYANSPAVPSPSPAAAPSPLPTGASVAADIIAIVAIIAIGVFLTKRHTARSARARGLTHTTAQPLQQPRCLLCGNPPSRPNAKFCTRCGVALP
jgi:hypothetical protein